MLPSIKQAHHEKRNDPTGEHKKRSDTEIDKTTMIRERNEMSATTQLAC